MVSNNICEECDKAEVCKIRDILLKFDKDAKKPLGVDITIDDCINHKPIEED